MITGKIAGSGGSGSRPRWAAAAVTVLVATGLLAIPAPARAQNADDLTGIVTRLLPAPPTPSAPSTPSVPATTATPTPSHEPAKPRKPPTPAKVHRLPKLPKGSTRLATLRVDAPRYARPGKRAKGTVPMRWFGRPSVLPVIATRVGWVKVRLAQRPNGSTAWLRDSDVTLGRTPYRIVIDLSKTHLYLYRNGHRVMSAAAGVGAPDDPTPRGTFFVAFRQAPPRPGNGYGRFILVTSAHSAKIHNWEGSGDAVIGIHGPLGKKKAIGKRGARISHGCIRLYNKSLNKLGSVPPGTPIHIRQ